MAEPVLREPLTEKQAAVLNFIRAYVEEHWYQPSYAEIAEHFGWNSDNTVTCHMREAKRKGYVKIMGARAVKFL